VTSWRGRTLPPAVSTGKREMVADWLMVLAAPILFGSLFLTWSHQFSAAARAAYGATAALQTVARDPTGWQVYSISDVLMALLAVGLFGVALRGGRLARIVVAVAVAVAAAFTLHALSVPPTNGPSLFDPTLVPPAYTPNAPVAGPGETLALVALGLGLTGLLISFTADF
jgi:hypothetical protein